MKKTFLIIAILCFISNSFAGQLYLSASGFYPSGPAETGVYDSVYISDYYNYVTISGGTSNQAVSDAFCFTDVVYTDATGWHQFSNQYGGPGNDSANFYHVIGTVNQSSTVGVNLEVFGLDGWATLNY
ncbi:hypothetical protein [Mucilaginibacter auburnensis]|uniref:Uncharacterized protein n=1 Tax=Mucilaginibacter auburnensis TaxID=1457233 RepID=A0A2H9VRC2_9SPHI|nr:hypothetical protein [Mucilaginibacter auburnensis]PJJ83364.1 hypothetical protein CLV57_0344 [Mucilaginibacter auburnensis]